MSDVWKPTREDMTRVLQEQNPWRTTGTVPDAMARQIERSMGKHLWRSALRAEPRRFQVILGPRRVGKTTVMYQTVRHLLEAGIAPSRLFWIRLDHPLLLQTSLDDLMGSVTAVGAPTMQNPAFVFLDELVYATDWDLWLKTFYDQQYPIRIVATSSATAALRNKRPDSGIGRWEEQCLMPYLFTEFVDLVLRDAAPTLPIQQDLHESIRAVIDMPPLDPQITMRLESLRRAFLFTGGFPELLLSVNADADETSMILESQRILRADAVERAIYKDIPQAFAVASPLHLERLLYVLAGQATGVLSPTNICKELSQLSQPTFDRYLSYFERAFLVFTLPNYSGREAAVQKRGRKLYFVDGAIRNAALQRGLAPLNNPTEMGILLENVAASQLHALAIQSQVRLFHWRDAHDEVDLVYNHPDHPMAFEIAASADHPRHGLVNFLHEHPRFQGRGYLVAPDAQPIAPEQTPSGVGTLPMDLFLLTVGRQAEAALQAHLSVGEGLPAGEVQTTFTFPSASAQPS